jgi:hypothetical protein
MIKSYFCLAKIRSFRCFFLLVDRIIVKSHLKNFGANELFSNVTMRSVYTKLMHSFFYLSYTLLCILFQTHHRNITIAKEYNRIDVKKVSHISRESVKNYKKKIQVRIQGIKSHPRIARKKNQSRIQEHKNLVWRGISCLTRQDCIYKNLARRSRSNLSGKNLD